VYTPPAPSVAAVVAPAVTAERGSTHPVLRRPQSGLQSTSTGVVSVSTAVTPQIASRSLPASPAAAASQRTLPDSKYFTHASPPVTSTATIIKPSADLSSTGHNARRTSTNGSLQLSDNVSLMDLSHTTNNWSSHADGHGKITSSTTGAPAASESVYGSYTDSKRVSGGAAAVRQTTVIVPQVAVLPQLHAHTGTPSVPNTVANQGRTGSINNGGSTNSNHFFTDDAGLGSMMQVGPHAGRNSGVFAAMARSSRMSLTKHKTSAGVLNTRG